MKSLFLGWKPSHLVSEWAWVWQSCWCHFRKSWCHQQSSLFWFFGLLCVQLESLVIIFEMAGDLGCNNIQKQGGQAVYKTTYMTRVMRSERRPFCFYFHIEYCSVRFISGRWNCYGNRGMEVQKVPGNFVKSFSRVLLSLLETSIVFLRNCIIWILSLIILNYWIYSFWHEISKYFKIKSPF